MMNIRRGYGLILIAAVLAASGLGDLRAHAAPPAAAKPGAKPWEPEDGCRWWLSREDGKSLRASIGQGDDGLILSLADPAFVRWSELGRHAIELQFNGDSRRRVKAIAWVTHGPPDDVTATFGVELDRAALQKMAGATRLELFRDGQSVFVQDLAGTPSRAVLAACIPDPNRGRGCEE